MLMYHVHCLPQKNCEIPKDIEGERFGPLSGSNFERRVVEAFLHKKLDAKPGCEDALDVMLCTACGAQGA